MALKIAAVAVGLATATATPTLAGDYKGGSMKDGGFVDQPTWIATYTGADFAKDSFYSYSGAVISLQRDLSRSGFVFQGFAGYGSYEYDSTVPGGKVDGDVTQLAAMLGYLWVRQGAAVGLYIGADYHDHDLTPNDPTNSVRGDEVGFRVGGDIRLYGPQHYFSLEGYYSTAFDTYWSRARVGMNLGRFIIGPEASADGNDGYDAQRLGAFAMFKLDIFGPRNPAELTIHGGYQFVDDDNNSFRASSSGGEGAYAGFNLSFAF
ncbi:MAG TPA: cellulose biosynthesis protein BcsS [Hyphomicrobiaceae bacterium]|nr:cellulose biosynthesis protein BcsS [Hyphomicrobiaceae bacterium]